MFDLFVSLGQLISLATLLLGFLLLGERARHTLVNTYVTASLDRIGGRLEARVRELATGLAASLFIGAAGKPSLLKTFAIGLASALSLGVPVATDLMLSVFTGSSGDVGFSRLIVWQYLPMTILVHWASEFFLASILWRALHATPQLRLWKVTVRVAAGLLIAFAAPVLLSLILLRFGGESLLAEIGSALLLTGPNVVILISTINFLMIRSQFLWLAVASCMTISSVILILAYSALLIRFKKGHQLLGALVSRAGPASGPFLIAVSITAFGLLTDLASSKSALASLLGF